MQPSVSASASPRALPARASALSLAPLSAEPAWSTTPSAPIASPIRRACTSEAIDLRRISRSSLAQLMR